MNKSILPQQPSPDKYGYFYSVCPKCKRSKVCFTANEGSRICPLCGANIPNPHATTVPAYRGKNSDLMEYLDSEKFERDFQEAVKEKAEAR